MHFLRGLPRTIHHSKTFSVDVIRATVCRLVLSFICVNVVDVVYSRWALLLLYMEYTVKVSGELIHSSCVLIVKTKRLSLTVGTH